MKKILIHCPVAIKNEQSYSSILNLDTSGIEANILFTMYDPYPPKYSADGRELEPKWGHNVAYKMSYAQRICLEHGYDGVLNIEHDMIVPPEALHILCKYSEPDNCVCGAYRGRKTRNPNTPICCKTLDKKWPKWDYIKDLEKVPLWIIPFGCTLVGREVLEKIKFDAGIDGSFAHQTEELGTEKWLIPSVICGHIDRDGTIYWPDKNRRATWSFNVQDLDTAKGA